MRLNLERTDLKELIDESIKSFLIKAKDKQIELSYDHSALSPFTQIDRRMVKRVFANLINNAIRHTPSGGKIKIATGSYQNNGNLQVEVKDTGNGIDPVYHQKVFDKFCRHQGRGDRQHESSIRTTFRPMSPSSTAPAPTRRSPGWSNAPAKCGSFNQPSTNSAANPSDDAGSGLIRW